MARYSASVQERATTDCFFALQDRRQELRKMLKPVVDRRSSGPAAQSKSQKAWRVRELLEKNKLWSRVPLRYHRTLLAAIQCVVMGECINWHSWLTEKAMLGQVRVQYWSAPTIWRYLVTLERETPSRSESLEPEVVGVEHGLALTLWARWRSSVMYLDWER